MESNQHLWVLIVEIVRVLPKAHAKHLNDSVKLVQCFASSWGETKIVKSNNREPVIERPNNVEQFFTSRDFHTVQGSFDVA